MRAPQISNRGIPTPMKTPIHDLPQKWRDAGYAPEDADWQEGYNAGREECAAELEAALADAPVEHPFKITQIMMTPNDSNWQGMLLGLGSDGIVYRSTSNDEQPWVPFIAAPTPPKP